MAVGSGWGLLPRGPAIRASSFRLGRRRPFRPYKDMVLSTYQLMVQADVRLRMGRCEGQCQSAHGIGFESAQHAFLDPLRVIAEDLDHGGGEQRYFCFGRVDGAVLTVRFTWRNGKIRIFGAGYWRKGKAIYEKANG